ncbi:MAG TPA: translation initiation factor IF-3 [Solirubrobacteraceae bacterium]|nr:translation initiation factor IF-3 [Solirubrobacteraceae bacterium]
MPVPRRLDRRPPERDPTRINERIRVPEVRLIDEEGNQVGVVPTDQAFSYAQERDLDLVEVAPEARPPVCRVLDYSKYKYEQAQKQKQARKHQQQITIREIKFRPKIAERDYETKKGHVERFLRHRDKVKITIMFRGREVTHPERGTAILDRLAGELSELAVIEQHPTQDGRNMTMLLAPSRSLLAGHLDQAKPNGATQPAAEATADGEAQPAAEAAAGNEAKPAAEATADSEAEPAAETTADGEAKPTDEAPPDNEARSTDEAPPPEAAPVKGTAARS